MEAQQIQTVSIEMITPAVLHRHEVRGWWVRQLMFALDAGKELPPVVVFQPEDKDLLWLADGLHRYHAYQSADVEDVPAIVYDGDRCAAIGYSAGCLERNGGLERTDEDARAAVGALLNDASLGKWSQKKIGEVARVTPAFVGQVAGELRD
jgi:hypothetical protein